MIQTPKVLNHCFDTTNCSVAFSNSLTLVKNKGAFTAYIDELQDELDKGSCNTGFAIGVLDCDDLKLVNDVVRRADQIMYEEKRLKKTGWPGVFKPLMHI